MDTLLEHLDGSAAEDETDEVVGDKESEIGSG